VILGTLFLNERLHWTALLGGALILSGIAVVNVKQLPVGKAIGTRMDTEKHG
jgi:drug/metabolite transporter (DMT)-like permease